ncbi:hypothetical protein, partial [Nostoc sp. CALU 1950]|uniref:hypothetical protein n=1 Tax=Nostoc sp. CALU 1950 TaxID=3104321 RepID=UPI003EBEC54E
MKLSLSKVFSRCVAAHSSFATFTHICTQTRVIFPPHLVEKHRQAAYALDISKIVTFCGKRTSKSF